MQASYVSKEEEIVGKAKRSSAANHARRDETTQGSGDEIRDLINFQH